MWRTFPSQNHSGKVSSFDQIKVQNTILILALLFPSPNAGLCSVGRCCGGDCPPQHSPAGREPRATTGGQGQAAHAVGRGGGTWARQRHGLIAGPRRTAGCVELIQSCSGAAQRPLPFCALPREGDHVPANSSKVSGARAGGQPYRIGPTGPRQSIATCHTYVILSAESL